jgi:uncharacterized protein
MPGDVTAGLFLLERLMSTTTVLMPKATAVWMVEETALTFDQIAAFCGLHPLEVQGIANEEVAKGIRGVDPIAGGFLSREEIEKGEADQNYVLKPLEQKRIEGLEPNKKRKGARYTPIARRGDRPDAIAWFLRNHPEVPDSQIVKLIGTTKKTIEEVRGRTHWNANSIKPVDPVSIGLCSQIELDAVVGKAAADKARDDAKRAKAKGGASLMPATETVDPAAYARANAPKAETHEEDELDPDAMEDGFLPEDDTIEADAFDTADDDDDEDN